MFLRDCWNYPAGIYFFKVNNENTRTMCEICSKLTTTKTPERSHWRRSGVFVVNFEQISHNVVVFPLLLWTSKCRLGTYSIVNSDQFFLRLTNDYGILLQIETTTLLRHFFWVILPFSFTSSKILLLSKFWWKNLPTTS